MYYGISVYVISSNLDYENFINLLLRLFFSILSTDKTTIFLWLYIKSARIFTNSSSEVGETLKNNNFMSSRCCFYFGWWASFEPTSGLNGVDIASQDENVASDYFRTTISGKKLPICKSMSDLIKTVLENIHTLFGFSFLCHNVHPPSAAKWCCFPIFWDQPSP